MKILKCEIVAVSAVCMTAFGAFEDDVPYLRASRRTAAAPNAWQETSSDHKWNNVRK
jgi:hypothetical protein